MKDKTFAKIVVIVSILICLPLFLFVGRSLSDDGDTYRTYDGSFQVIKYNYYQHPTGITITMRDEDSRKVIEAKVKVPCRNLPINKIIKATIRETTKDFGIFDKNYYEVIDGKVCL